MRSNHNNLHKMARFNVKKFYPSVLVCFTKIYMVTKDSTSENCFQVIRTFKNKNKKKIKSYEKCRIALYTLWCYRLWAYLCIISTLNNEKLFPFQMKIKYQTDRIYSFTRHRALTKRVQRSALDKLVQLSQRQRWIQKQQFIYYLLVQLSLPMDLVKLLRVSLVIRISKSRG